MLIFGLKKWPFLLPRKTSLFCLQHQLLLSGLGILQTCYNSTSLNRTKDFFQSRGILRVCDLLVTSFELLVATILDRIKWNSKLPSPQIKDEAAQKPRRAISPSLIQRPGGRGVGSCGKNALLHLSYVEETIFPETSCAY